MIHLIVRHSTGSKLLAHSMSLSSMHLVVGEKCPSTSGRRSSQSLPQRLKHIGKRQRISAFSGLMHSKGGFLFAQQAIPLLVEATKSNPKHPPTLVFTGATASAKASAGFSAFACAKWGVRALSQSLAKEFGPQGVHVCHIVADGVFDTPSRKEMDPNGDDEPLMSTEGMAESYWFLHIQPRRAWSWEIDLRPYLVIP